MTTNDTRPGSDRGGSQPDAGKPMAPGAGLKLPMSIGKERLEALRCDLDENSNHWPEHMAATIDEDYRQLMKDFGLH